MKKLDGIIIIFLVFISILPIGLVFKKGFCNDKKEVVISYDGKIHSRFLLNEVKNKEVLIESSGHKNLVYIRDGKVIMKETDCKDKICMKQGEISKVGESIVCLPNKVFIEIKGKEKSDIILSH